MTPCFSMRSLAWYSCKFRNRRAPTGDFCIKKEQSKRKERLEGNKRTSRALEEVKTPRRKKEDNIAVAKARNKCKKARKEENRCSKWELESGSQNRAILSLFDFSKTRLYFFWSLDIPKGICLKLESERDRAKGGYHFPSEP